MARTMSLQVETEGYESRGFVVQGLQWTEVSLEILAVVERSLEFAQRRERQCRAL